MPDPGATSSSEGSSHESADKRELSPKTSDFSSFKRKLECVSSELCAAGPKWKRRRDVEQARVQQYLLNQQQQQQKDHKAAQPSLQATPAEDGQQQLVVLEEQGRGVGEDGMSKCPPREEIIRRLRDVREPVTLFGESDYDRWIRLRQLQISGHYDMLVEQGTNDFQEQLKRNTQTAMDGSSESKELTEEQKKEKSLQVIATMQAELDGMQQQIQEDSFGCDEDYIYCVLMSVLKNWELSLEQRPSEAKVSTRGLRDAAFFQQTRNYTEPLFAALQARLLTVMVLEPLKHIACNVQAREYVRANEWYVRLAIGNAPWPLGVTRHGIHERAFCEKFYCANVAHILNNETQRRYIQGLKRILTQAQKLYPTVPSKSVW